MDSKPRIRIVDSTLRDGMHAVSHQFTPKDMAEIAAAAEKACIDTIEVSHGDGLAGASINYGFPAASDREYLEAVSAVLNKTKLAILLLPGIGTVKDLEEAISCGAQVARIATHVTEADISQQHIEVAKEKGIEVLCFLMMAHMGTPKLMVEQASLMQRYGADCVYVVDSAGALTPDGVRDRVSALKDSLEIPIGFHGHNNLGLGIGNTIAAVETGATIVDGSLCGLGAGSGNAATEVLVAVLEKMGYSTGVKLYEIMDAAEEVVKPKLRRPQEIDRNALTMGYAGVYSSFLLHARKAAEQFNIDARDILIELGKRKVVGGQEDWIFDTAYEIAHNK